MKLIILFLSFILSVNFCFEAELDSTVTTSQGENFPIFGHKKEKKWKKERDRKRSRKPNAASAFRLNRISRQAKGTMARIDYGHRVHKSEIKNKQRDQRKYSKRKDHQKNQKSRLIKRKKPRKIRKVRGLDDVKSRR
jgi:hypothetical protein